MARSSNLRCTVLVIGCSYQRESIPRDSNGSVKPLLKHLARRKLGEILRHVNAARVEIEVLDGLALLARAKNDTQRRFFCRLALMAIKPAQVQFDLTRVGRLEVAEFELDGHESAHAPVKEEEIDVVVVVVHNDSLPFDPSLDPVAQRGLDRLRCVADRALAEDLFVLFQMAERNTMNTTDSGSSRRPEELKRLRVLAARAIKGELGPKPREALTTGLMSKRTRERRRKRDEKRATAKAESERPQLISWAVAFLDILGYSSVLEAMDVVPLPAGGTPEAEAIIASLAKAVRLRRRLHKMVPQFMSSAAGSADESISELPPELRAIAEQSLTCMTPVGRDSPSMARSTLATLHERSVL